LVAALDPQLPPPGGNGDGVYLSDCEIVEPAPWAKDPAMAEKLWTMSEELVGERFHI